METEEDLHDEYRSDKPQYVMFKENVIALTFVRLFGLLSMVASGFIIRDIAKKLAHRSGSFLKRVSLTQSILIVLSASDFSAAFIVQFVSSWMGESIDWRLFIYLSSFHCILSNKFVMNIVPHHSKLLGSTGSQQSCVAQGFLSALFYSLSVFSNASLAVAYCLIVRKGWGDKDENKNRLPFILIPIVFAIVFAVIPLFGQNYNYNGGYSCFISGDPPGCEIDPTTCNRGANARIMMVVTGIVPYYISLVIIVVAVTLLIHAVFVQEKRMDRYNRGGPSRKMTLESCWQGIFYIGSFLIAWTPWFIFSIREVNDQNISKIAYYTMLMITPLHGVINSTVYFRPRYLAKRGRHPTDSRCSSLMQVLNIKCCCNRKTKQEADGKSPIATKQPAADQEAEIGRKEEIEEFNEADDTPIIINPEMAKDVEQTEREEKVESISYCSN